MCVYAHMSVWVCACVHVIAHACRWDTFTALTPERSELIVFFYLCIFIYIYVYIYLYIIYPEYISHIYPESTGFDNSQDGRQNSHDDYKNTVSRVECR